MCINMYIWGSEFLKNHFHVHACLCKNIYWTMCPGGNRSWLCSHCTYGSQGSSKASQSLSSLCVGSNFIPTVQPRHDVVEGVWGSVIMFLSQVLKEVHGSWVCGSVCTHVQVPICIVGTERLGTQPPLPPQPNFALDMDASFHFLLFCGFYFW